MFKLVESFLTNNPCYKKGQRITVKGLMLHSVGCAQSSASVFIKNWNRASYSRACVHGFIDGNDGTVYQTLPWNYRGWHCGGTGNNTHIGVEMCEPSVIKYTGGSTFTCPDMAKAQESAKKTYEAAVVLFAMLCERFSLDPLADGVILSHSEGSRRGVASSHADPEHLWTQLSLPYTMDSFRNDVRKAMVGESSAGIAASEMTEANINAYFKAQGLPYKVRVSIPDLNIRKGPGTDYGKTGKYTGVGVFTIVEESDGRGASRWGLLKAYESSRNGWVSLDHAERIIE